MKLPNPPKSFNVLFEKHAKYIPEIYSKVGSGLYKSKYLHWEELRFKPSPEGLTPEQHWLGMKLRRSPLLQKTPLKDKAGEPFAFLQPDPIPELLHSIDMAAGGRIEISPLITNAETKDRYYLSSLIEEAITSSQIEGAAVTREVAKEMLRTGRKPRDRSERMIVNNFLTMRRIGELRHEELSIPLILEIHRLVTDQTLGCADCSGRFRRSSEEVEVGDEFDSTLVYHVPPPATELRKRVQSMCDFANGKTQDRFVHPILKAVILHFWLAYDHPFVDGNGRTARALFYWAMLRSGYWLMEFVSISHVIRTRIVQYYQAFLFTESDENDLTYFLLFHLDVMKKAIDALNAYIAKKTEEVRSLERGLKGMGRFNYRQRALLSHALRHPSHIYTVESHRNSHNVVTQTARSDLLQLVEVGLLESERAGRRWQFTPVTELEATLRRLPA